MARSMRSYPLATFFVLVFVITWAVWVPRAASRWAPLATRGPGPRQRSSPYGKRSRRSPLFFLASRHLCNESFQPIPRRFLCSDSRGCRSCSP